MKRSYWLLLLLVGGLCGCQGTKSDVATHYDAMSGTRTDLLSDNLLEGSDPPREVVYLNASRDAIDYLHPDYYLEVLYVARPDVGFLEIGGGASLVLNIDGYELRLSGGGSSGMRETRKDVVSERAVYAVRKIDLQRIATGQKVSVEIKGHNGLVQREFKETNFEKFRKFVTRYAL